MHHGARLASVGPYELEAHVGRHGNYLADGATIEAARLVDHRLQPGWLLDEWHIYQL